MSRKLLLPILLLFTIVTAFSVRIRMDAAALNVVALDSPCVILYKGERYENIDPARIGDWLDVPFDVGEEITLIRTLPESLHAYDNVHEAPCLMLETNYCDVDVYVDGVLTDASVRAENNRMSGDDLLFAYLPPDYASKELRLVFTVRERFLVDSFEAPRLGSYAEVLQQYLRENMIALFVGSFLCITGILFLFVTFIFMFLTPGVGGQMISSIICVMMGVSTLTNYHMASLILGMKYETVLSYIALYLALPLLVLLVRRVYRLRFLVINLILLIVSTAFATVSIVLSFATSLHICDFWYAYQALGLFTIVYAIAAHISVQRTTHLSFQGKLQMAGPTVYAVFSLLSNLIYLFRFLPGTLTRTVSLFLLMIGMMMFAITRFFLYLVYVRESVSRRREFSALSSLAYVDKLTELPNRTRCDEKFYELNHSSLDYCIVSLDLNGLKFVNDNYGHDAGDRLLRGFSAVMLASFGNAGLCCRMGGDEFLVVFDSISEKQVNDRLNHMQMLLVKLDEQEPLFRHSCAYGVAFHHELTTGDAHDIYMLADQRMYDRKMEQYKTLNIARRT